MKTIAAPIAPANPVRKSASERSIPNIQLPTTITPAPVTPAQPVVVEDAPDLLGLGITFT